MLATHLFGVERAGTALGMGGTESGLSFDYDGNTSPLTGGIFLLQGTNYITDPLAG